MRQYTPLQVPVPAGTPQSAPVAVTWTLYPGWVNTFRVQIPPGHNGLTGVRLVYQSTPVVPFAAAGWLVGDKDVFEIPWDDEIMNRGLVAQAYNTDVHPHTFWLYADVDPYRYRQLPSITPAALAGDPPLAALSGIGGLQSAPVLPARREEALR
jgi:hypothetical protein